MKRRWPNTKHWQRLESVCRETHGSRWRTAAAILVQRDRRDLRASVDHDMHPVEIKKLDKLLVGHLDRYISRLRRRIVHIDNAARAVMRATNEISTVCEDNMMGKDPECEGEVRQFFSDWAAKMLEEA
jgi:hypothetical protein